MDKKKILIVDDDSRNIFALAATLKAKSYDCVSCNGAEEALQLLATDARADVVLLDMMMPDMDGYEAIPLIKQLPGRQSLPVIAVTAQAMIGDREKCIRAGADGYISKPIDVDKLLEVLNTV
ncbi:response regulator [Flavobacterium sp. NRK1]|uniref:response regulator n=1 Tax=Flavobacterium sp. NRK1 TaxID=2954929 RepID=UPI002093722E|nr:response regulator [Flavobacterium sp. NRK1]MCO6149585.1 response regulator [Flavobacterium sp. NRK1]